MSAPFQYLAVGFWFATVAANWVHDNTFSQITLIIVAAVFTIIGIAEMILGDDR